MLLLPLPPQEDGYISFESTEKKYNVILRTAEYRDIITKKRVRGAL